MLRRDPRVRKLNWMENKGLQLHLKEPSIGTMVRIRSNRNVALLSKTLYSGCETFLLDLPESATPLHCFPANKIEREGLPETRLLFQARN